MIRKLSIFIALTTCGPAIADSVIAGPPPIPKNESELQVYLDHLYSIAALQLKGTTIKLADAKVGTKMEWGQFGMPHGEMTAQQRDGNCTIMRQQFGNASWNFNACKRADGGIDIKDLAAEK